MDQIKEAFRKVKADMDSIKEELEGLNSEIFELKKTLKSLVVPNNLQNVSEEVPKNQQTDKPTDRQVIQTVPTHIPTNNMPFKPQKHQNLAISTGNRGVPTDRQTDKPTDRQTNNLAFSSQKIPSGNSSIHSSIGSQNNIPLNGKIDDALEILNSLDSLKKGIRLKFKYLTDQEFAVFSILYQLDEEYGFSDYKTLSNILHLSESSIRDYVGKLIKKDIPVEKIRVNNKMIKLTISQNLKKIASLQTILQLREL